MSLPPFIYLFIFTVVPLLTQYHIIFFLLRDTHNNLTVCWVAQTHSPKPVVHSSVLPARRCFNLRKKKKKCLGLEPKRTKFSCNKIEASCVFHAQKFSKFPLRESAAEECALSSPDMCCSCEPPQILPQLHQTDFFFILWRESELQSRLQQQQQHWAGCNNAEQTQTTCPRQCTAQAKCYLGYACDIDNKTVLLSSPVNRFNVSECFSLWLQTFFHLMHMYLQPLPVSLKHWDSWVAVPPQWCLDCLIWPDG